MGDKEGNAKYGYSRDHRPDKKQITFGAAELRKPINILISFTIDRGNVNDQAHFQTTFNWIKRHLEINSLAVFDKGGNSKENINLVIASNMQFLTAKKLNTSDDK